MRLSPRPWRSTIESTVLWKSHTVMRLWKSWRWGWGGRGEMHLEIEITEFVHILIPAFPCWPCTLRSPGGWCLTAAVNPLMHVGVKERMKLSSLTPTYPHLHERTPYMYYPSGPPLSSRCRLVQVPGTPGNLGSSGSLPASQPPNGVVPNYVRASRISLLPEDFWE